MKSVKSHPQNSIKGKVDKENKMMTRQEKKSTFEIKTEKHH